MAFSLMEPERVAHFIIRVGGLGIPLAISGTLDEMGQGQGRVAGTLHPPNGKLPASVAKFTNRGQWIVGASKVDITPLPGIHMGGYYLVGKTSRGCWERLTARALYFADPSGGHAVVVAAELPFGSAAMCDRIASLVHEKEPSLGREHMIIGVTHTHTGPGNYCGHRAYNKVGSNTPGFYPELFEYIAAQIAVCILQSVHHAIPSIIRHGVTRVGGMQVNRSYDAFITNGKDAEDIIASNADLPPIEDIRSDIDAAKAGRAVNPDLNMMVMWPVDEGGAVLRQVPHAILCSYSLHPVSLGPDTQIHSGDIFGTATTLTEQKLARLLGVPVPTGEEGLPICCLMQGTEGDMSPPLRVKNGRNRAQTLMYGQQLSKGIIEGITHVETQPVLELGEGGVGVEHSFAMEQLAAVTWEQDGVKMSVPSDAIPGPAQVGGTEDASSIWRHMGFNEGHILNEDPRPEAFDPCGCCGCCGVCIRKMMFGDKDYWPRSFPCSVFRIGGVMMAAMPGECTIVAGKRIARAMVKAVQEGDVEDAKPPPTPMLFLANEYMGYMATREEYKAKHYEGASTIYGSNSVSRIAFCCGEHVKKLTSKVSQTHERKFGYFPGIIVDHSPSPIMLPPLGTYFLKNILVGPDGKPTDQYVQMEWDGEAEDVAYPLSYDIAKGPVTVLPEACVEIQGDDLKWSTWIHDGIPEDDQGINFVQVFISSLEIADVNRWRVYWFVPEGVTCDSKLRICVKTRHGKQHAGNAFTLPLQK